MREVVSSTPRPYAPPQDGCQRASARAGAGKVRSNAHRVGRADVSGPLRGTHRNPLSIPECTGRDIVDRLRTVDEAPSLVRFEEKAGGLRSEHELTYGRPSGNGAACRHVPAGRSVDRSLRVSRPR
ncbi:DUF4287 domain-containing protein [Kitasatospora cinereorecta]